MPNRRDLFKLAAFNTLIASTSADNKLPNGTLDKSQAKVTHETFGDLRLYHEGSTDQLGALTFGSLLLKPGMSPHPPHQHPEEEFMIVADGTGEIFCDGKTTEVGPGAIMYCAGNVLHGITNTGQVPMTFYWSKWTAKGF